MQLKILSTFESNIHSVQLKLSDYFSGISTLKEGIISHFTDSNNKNINNSHELVLHAENQFELLNPKCPVCGSSKVIKQEYYQRNLKLAEFGQKNIQVRRYYCKACNKKFTTPLDPIVGKGHQYAKIYQKNIIESYKTGYSSFRHLKKIFLSLYENAPSHQTIYNWINNFISESTCVDSKFSGYYCYDEQYLRFNGLQVYRLSLFDSVLNKPVIEDIFDNLEYNTIYAFIKKGIAGKPVHAITTDHRRKYKKIMDKLKIYHQLCIFHFFKMIGKIVYPKLNSELVSDRDKFRICILFTEIKEIFRTFDLNIGINRLDALLKHKEIPAIFHKTIEKIVRDFERLTLFMRDGFVSRTTNPIENYYRNTIPNPVKRIFKTSNGTLNFLNMRREYWIENISKNI